VREYEHEYGGVRRHTKAFLSRVAKPVKAMRFGWVITARRCRQVPIQSRLPDLAITNLACRLRWTIAGTASMTSTMLLPGITRLSISVTLSCGVSPGRVYTLVV
jgi:hypothetical protein